MGSLDTIIAARRQIEAAGLVLTFDVRGTFEPVHQRCLQAVTEGDPLWFVKDPLNPYDASAIDVKRMNGAILGRVPAEHMHKFPQQETFGSAERLYYNAQHLLCLDASVQPDLPTLSVNIIPASVRHLTDLSRILDAYYWAGLSYEVFCAAGHRCSVTNGIGGRPRLVASPLWHIDTEAQVVRLTGLQAVAPEIDKIRTMTRTAQGPAACTATQAALQQLNRWSAKELGVYLNGVDAREAALSGAGWRLDVAWLSQQGIPIPAALATPGDN